MCNGVHLKRQGFCDGVCLQEDGIFNGVEFDMG